MSEERIDTKMALARYESAYAVHGVEACFTLKGLRHVQAYIEQLEYALRLYAGYTTSDGVRFQPIEDKGGVARAALAKTHTSTDHLSTE